VFTTLNNQATRTNGKAAESAFAQAVPMSSLCSFCQHTNPADARYCNECGCTLQLKPCERCDAINALNATHCHHCGGDFTRSPSTAGTATSTAAEYEAQVRSSVVRAVERVGGDLRRFPRGDGQKFARQVCAILGAAVLIAASGAVFYGDRESVPIGTPTATRSSARVDVASVASATSPQLPPTKPITVLQVPHSEATNNPVNAGNGWRDIASSARAVTVPRQDPEALSAGATERPPSSVSTAITTSLPAATAATAAKVGEPAQARRAKRSPVSKHAGIASSARASPYAATTFPSDDLPSSSFEPPQYRTTSGTCSDGVAALGLCKKQDPSGAR
jgi:ribosomal protein L40E